MFSLQGKNNIEWFHKISDSIRHLIAFWQKIKYKYIQTYIHSHAGVL